MVFLDEDSDVSTAYCKSSSSDEWAKGFRKQRVTKTKTSLSTEKEHRDPRHNISDHIMKQTIIFPFERNDYLDEKARNMCSEDNVLAFWYPSVRLSKHVFFSKLQLVLFNLSSVS